MRYKEPDNNKYTVLLHTTTKIKPIKRIGIIWSFERFTNQVIGSNYIDLIINHGCQRHDKRDIIGSSSYNLIIHNFNMRNKLNRKSKAQ